MFSDPQVYAAYMFTDAEPLICGKVTLVACEPYIPLVIPHVVQQVIAVEYIIYSRIAFHNVTTVVSPWPNGLGSSV